MNIKQEKFTYKQFQQLYPNDIVCLEKFFQLRYGATQTCGECNKPLNTIALGILNIMNVHGVPIKYLP